MTLLAVEHLSVVRGTRVVLADVNLTIPGPGVHAVLGPGGAGKSTLLHVLSGAFLGHRDVSPLGSIQILGLPLAEENVVPTASQRAQMVGASLFDVLASGLAFRATLTRAEQRQRIELLLRNGERPELIGLLDRELVELTMGQRRYVIVLRTLLSQLPVVALDEPTAGLEDAEAEPILALIERASVRRGILFVTHNQRQARRLASWATLLAAAQVVESGPAEQFFHAPQTEDLRSFLRTGGCARPSLEADPEELEEPWRSELFELRTRLAAQGIEVGRRETEEEVEAVPVVKSTPAASSKYKIVPSSVTPAQPDVTNPPRSAASVANAPAAADAAWLGSWMPRKSDVHAAVDVAPATPATSVAPEPLVEELALHLDEAAFDDSFFDAAMQEITDAGLPVLSSDVTHPSGPEEFAAETVTNSAPTEPGAAQQLWRDGVPVPGRPRKLTGPVQIISERQGPNGYRWVRAGRLGGVPRPGLLQDLDYDLEGLKRVGIGALVSLTTRPVDPAALARFGIEGLHRPVVDMKVPSIEDAAVLCAWVSERLRRGVAVAFHCRAGLGRTGTALATQLIWEEGLSGEEALAAVRTAEARYVQSAEQEEFLIAFAAWAHQAAGTRSGEALPQNQSVTA